MVSTQVCFLHYDIYDCVQLQRLFWGPGPAFTRSRHFSADLLHFGGRIAALPNSKKIRWVHLCTKHKAELLPEDWTASHWKSWGGTRPDSLDGNVRLHASECLLRPSIESEPCNVTLSTLSPCIQFLITNRNISKQQIKQEHVSGLKLRCPSPGLLQ